MPRDFLPLTLGTLRLRVFADDWTHRDRRIALVAIALGFTGALLVNASGTEISGAVGVTCLAVAVLVAFLVSLYRPLYVVPLAVMAVLFPIQLTPFTLTVAATVGVYGGVIVGAVIRGELAIRFGVTTLATIVFALAILVAAIGTSVMGTGVSADGGLKAARVFVFIMGLALIVPLVARGRAREVVRTAIIFICFVATGVSIWGILEYFGRLGLYPLVLKAWADDALGKSVVGAPSGLFVGGGPNTYAVFLLASLLLITASFIRARNQWTPTLLVPSVLICLNLAFTYSRGAHLAALVALSALALRWGKHVGRRQVLGLLGLLSASLVVAYGVSVLRTDSLTGLGLAPGHWRAFVSDPTWTLEQRIQLPAGYAPDTLWIKLRAAAGSDYSVLVTVNDSPVLPGRSQLPQQAREWFSVRLSTPPPAGSEVVVRMSLVGSGNQRDNYFEVEGTTNPLEGAKSRFLRGTSEFNNDLSLDPGTQSGSYLIVLSSARGEGSPAIPSEPATPVAGGPTRDSTSPPFPQLVATSLARTAVEDERWTLWRVAIDSFLERPVFGSGFYTSPQVLRGLPTSIDYANFHNQFLQFLSDSGIVGLSGMLLFVSALVFSAWGMTRGARRNDGRAALALGACAIGMVIAFQFGSFLADSRIAGLLWVVAGLIAAEAEPGD